MPGEWLVIGLGLYVRRGNDRRCARARVESDQPPVLDEHQPDGPFDSVHWRDVLCRPEVGWQPGSHEHRGGGLGAFDDARRASNSDEIAEVAGGLGEALLTDRCDRDLDAVATLFGTWQTQQFRLHADAHVPLDVREPRLPTRSDVRANRGPKCRLVMIASEDHRSDMVHPR